MHSACMKKVIERSLMSPSLASPLPPFLPPPQFFVIGNWAVVSQGDWGGGGSGAGSSPVAPSRHLLSTFPSAPFFSSCSRGPSPSSVSILTLTTPSGAERHP